MSYTYELAGPLLKGVIGDRPAASVGRYWYFATDDLVLSKSDGSTWTDIATLVTGVLAWGEASTAAFAGSGSPVGVVTPIQSGDLYVDETTPGLWQATGGTSADWQTVGGAGAVSSVFARTGAVIAASGDYAASQVTNTPAGGILATDVQGALNELDSEKVAANAGITGATKTKITYDTKGLVTAGADATTADIADSSNKRYVTDAELTVLGNTSGVNTGDQTSVSGNAGTATALQTGRTINGVTFDGTANITVPGGLAVFGDGSDGAVTFNGTSTLLGITPNPSSAVNGVYTLLRDIFLADGSALNSGISIVTNGYRVFCQGTFTNNGTIKWNGNNGAVSGAGGTATTNSVGSITTSATVGTVGGAGGTGVGTGGTNQSVAGYGGTGGQGGTSGANGGGSGGTQTAPNVASGSIRSAPTAVAALWTTGSATLLRITGGAGGGGGGGDGTAAGGGGAGGGVVMVAVKTFAGTGAIQARGGDGGNPTGGNRGGGGGGGGGLVIVISSSVSAGAIAGQTIDANGGSKGLPHGTATDNAANGNIGTAVIIPN